MSSDPVGEASTVPLPEVALRPALDRLVRDLDSHGVDSSRLRAMRDELDELDHPPGFFARLRRTVCDTVRRNWSHVVGEMQETAQLVSLVRKALSDGRSSLTAEEKSAARAQLADLFRMAPASAVFLALELFPIPGTAVFTPWVLIRLGLLPSRWREAHVLHGLRTEANELRTSDHPEEAEAVERLVEAVEEGCRRREKAAHDAALLTHWDFDGNGRWDPDELAAYEDALTHIVQAATSRSADKVWILRHSQYVFGPFRLSEVLTVDTDVELLVCLERDTPWVDLRDLKSRLEPGASSGAPHPDCP
jgi:hypothetical protein